jgi:NTE family protein
VIVDAAALMSSPVERSPVQVGILTSPLQQLVRRLLRRRVGLVLGAGGAKGLAHIGAVRSFERAGLRVDMLAGTSMGAIVATLVALGWSSERLHELAERVRRNFRRLLIDIHLSGSLLRGAKKRTLLAELTDGKTFEDLSVPLWIVTADLALQREFVFDGGDLAIALDATSAIPTIFPVVPFEERQLVDGWVVNPLPADVLRRKGADIVIGVDPNLADDRASRPHRSHRPRRWWRRLLDPRTLIDPVGMVRVAMQAMDVGARERTMANLALTDICVQPALGAYATTDVQKLPAILDAGEAAAEAALPGIHAALHLGAPTG